VLGFVVSKLKLALNILRKRGKDNKAAKKYHCKPDSCEALEIK